MEALDVNEAVTVQVGGYLDRVLQPAALLILHRRLELAKPVRPTPGKGFPERRVDAEGFLRAEIRGEGGQRGRGAQDILRENIVFRSGRVFRYCRYFLVRTLVVREGPFVSDGIGAFIDGQHISGVLQQVLGIAHQINETRLDQVFRDAAGSQVVHGERLQLIAGQPLIAVKVLRNIQREAELAAVLILQSGGEPLYPVLRALSPLIQNEPKVIPIKDKVLNALVLLCDISRLREDAFSLQQGAFVQALDPQGHFRHGDLAV